MLVAAALELSGADADPGGASLAAAEGLLEHLPVTDEIPARLAAAQVRLAVSRRTGDLDAALAAVASAESLLAEITGSLSPGIPRFTRRCFSVAARSNSGRAISIRRPLPFGRPSPPRPLPGQV